MLLTSKHQSGYFCPKKIKAGKVEIINLLI